MNDIALFEAKNRLSELINRVEAGEEIIITRRGKAVARLVPRPCAPRWPRPAYLRQHCRADRRAR